MPDGPPHKAVEPWRFTRCHMSVPQCGSRFPATVSGYCGSTGRDGDVIRDIGGRSFRCRLYGPFCGGPPACRPLITAFCAATASAAVAGSTRCAASTAANGHPLLLLGDVMAPSGIRFERQEACPCMV